MILLESLNYSRAGYEFWKGELQKGQLFSKFLFKMICSKIPLFYFIFYPKLHLILAVPHNFHKCIRYI